MQTFTRAEVAALLHVPPRQIEGWVARSIVVPVSRDPGTGTPHLFTFPETVRAAILVEAHECLGPRFVRPGFLSGPLHAEVSDHTIEHERRRIERTPPDPPAEKGRVRFPAGRPDDLILHVARDVEDRGDGVAQRTKELTVEIKKRSEEHIWPMGYAVLRIELTPILQALLRRLAQLKSA